jgi:hypothetical protein
VAGKGHEDYQIVADSAGDGADAATVAADARVRTRKVPFSDTQVIREAAGQLERVRPVLAAAGARELTAA